MKYVVVSGSEIRAKGIYNLVKEYLTEIEGIYLVGKYDMDYLLDEELDFLFFDMNYLKEYRTKISKKTKILVKNPVLVALDEEEPKDYYPHIKVINGNSTVDELKNMLEIKVRDEIEYNLSDRDKSILYLLSKGMSNKEIGKRLYLSEKTIKNNLTRIYKVLGVKNKYEAINKSKNLKEWPQCTHI